MRSKNEREPGLVWPGSLGEALQSLATQTPPAPCPTPSGPGYLYATSTTPVGLDISVPDVAGLDRGALQEDIPGLIRTVSWTDRTGMEVELRVLIAEDTGPRRRWARQMLIDVVRGADTDEGVAFGVREPAANVPAVGSGGAAMAVPHGEPELASAVSMA